MIGDSIPAQHAQNWLRVAVAARNRMPLALMERVADDMAMRQRLVRCRLALPSEDFALLLIDDFLDETTCVRLRDKILAMPFIGGSATAGDMAARVKKNLQLDPKKGRAIVEEIKSLVLNDPRIDLYALPLNIVGTMVNRYDVGMEYGIHSDSPTMEGARSDLSFTLFLEDAGNYDGGELILQLDHGTMRVKPKIGSIFIYPTGLLHLVSKVTRGSRLACVGWIHSRVRHEHQRRILRDLNSVLAAYVERNGQDEAADVQLKVIGDLLRMWHA